MRLSYTTCGFGTYLVYKSLAIYSMMGETARLSYTVTSYCVRPVYRTFTCGIGVINHIGVAMSFPLRKSTFGTSWGLGYPLFNRKDLA